jgi:hypothetical protein
MAGLFQEIFTHGGFIFVEKVRSFCSETANFIF